ncbi:MAG: hypothetical protein RJA70_135 [Pseudomonadota bacterium]|jgi:hypothetical protein
MPMADDAPTAPLFTRTRPSRPLLRVAAAVLMWEAAALGFAIAGYF